MIFKNKKAALCLFVSCCVIGRTQGGTPVARLLPALVSKELALAGLVLSTAKLFVPRTEFVNTAQQPLVALPALSPVAPPAFSSVVSRVVAKLADLDPSTVPTVEHYLGLGSGDVQAFVQALSPAAFSGTAAGTSTSRGSGARRVFSAAASLAASSAPASAVAAAAPLVAAPLTMPSAGGFRLRPSLGKQWYTAAHDLLRGDWSGRSRKMGLFDFIHLSAQVGTWAAVAHTSFRIFQQHRLARRVDKEKEKTNKNNPKSK